MAPPPFAYKYQPIHPFLHGRKPKITLQYILLITQCVICLPLLPLKVFFGVFFMALLDANLNLLNTTKIDNKAFSGWKLIAYKYICRFCCTGYLLSQGIIVKTSGTRELSAPVLVSNHRSLNDILIHTALHAPCFLHREDLVKSFGIGAIFRSSNSIPVSKTTSNKDAGMKMLQELNGGRQVCVFIEGTTSFDGAVLRPRPGAFKTGYPVQPVALRYFSAFGQAWLCESLLVNILLTAIQPITICKVEYLPVIDNESPDQCGKRIAEALQVQFLPYNNDDYWYFNGKAPDTSKCSNEYIKDFQWMGRHDDYIQLCKKAGKNHFYQWNLEELNTQ